MANDIDKTSPHYKGEFGSIYEVNQKFPSGGVEGDYVAIDGWAHYWNADRGTWCVNAQRDSYWDELITGIVEKFKLFKGATYMGVAGLDTVPAKAIGAKMYYFATVAGTYKNFGELVVPQGINVLYSENGSSWVCSTLLEVAQELGMSTRNVVSQKVVNEALAKKADKETVDVELGKKANTADVNTKFTEEKKRLDAELDKKFDKESVAQESGDSEELVMSQKAVSKELSDLSNKTKYISVEEILNESSAFAIKNDNETETIFEVQEDGVNAKNLKSNGFKVLIEKDLKGYATENELEQKQNLIKNLYQNEVHNTLEEQVWESDDESERFVSIGDYGIKSKHFLNNSNRMIEEESFLFINMNGASSKSYLWNNVWIGCNKQADRTLFLDEIEISQYNTDSDFYKEAEFAVGVIDQRGWTLVRKLYTAKFKSAEGNVITYTFNNAIIYKGEVLLYKANSNNNKTVVLSDAQSSVEVFCTQYFRDYYKLNKTIARWVVKCSVPKEGYAIQSFVENFPTELQSVKTNISKVSVLIDNVTGKHYRLVVSNGQLQVKNTDYKKILVLSNSWCTHGKNESIGWYGWNNTGMAASVEGNDFKNFIAKALNAVLVWKGISEIETKTDDLTSDYLEQLFSDLSFDGIEAIIICLGLNVSEDSISGMQQRWSAMIEYLKKKCNSADIFISPQNTTDSRKIEIVQQVSNIYNLFFVDLHSNWKENFNQQLGNYTFGNDEQYHEIVNGGVANHPCDYGMMYVANEYLSAMGLNPYKELTFNISINNTNGGTLVFYNSQWISGGVVSVKCIADDGYTIESVTIINDDGSGIEYSLKSNKYGTYCVFKMPKSNVSLSPVWKMI